MLCNKCNERTATIHLTQTAGDKVTKLDLCEVCGKEFVDLARSGDRSQNRVPIISEVEQIVDSVIARDSRYTKAAYFFMHEGMIKARKKHFGSACVPGNISGAELLESLRELAIETFGAQAKARLNGWGIFKCEDFGEMVFNLVEAGLMAKSAEDDRKDFQNGFDFDTAFPS
jgi:uncharacterized repeat protein (TIGR04138 family)